VRSRAFRSAASLYSGACGSALIECPQALVLLLYQSIWLDPSSHKENVREPRTRNKKKGGATKCRHAVI
jgi:hypothetical protein